MSTPSRWARLRRGSAVAGKGLLLLLVLYMVAGFVATRTVQDPVHFSQEALREVEGLARPAGGVQETLLRGAISVHTGRSHDAEGTLDEVGEAAARAGLDFVVLGDHVGDWAEGGPALLEPSRRRGVLLVPGLELVVRDAGRVLAVGMDTLPREWLGSVDELVAEVQEGDGFLSVVHPRSPRARERWSGLAPPGIDAWESFDISEMARLRQDEAWVGYRIAGLLATMTTGRGHESLARFWREGTETPALLAYDSARAGGRIALTGGLNHHPKARIFGHLVPAYAPFFRTVVNHVRVDAPLDADPVRARGQVLAGLRSGRLFVTLEEAEGVESFDLWTRSGDGAVARMGGGVEWVDSAVLGVELPPSAEGAPVRVLRDGLEVAWLEGRGGEVMGWPVPGPGSYRVEVFKPGWRVAGWRFGFRPWIVSNPVELFDGAPEWGDAVGDPEGGEG